MSAMKSTATPINAVATTCRFNEPDWIQDTEEPFIQRRDRLPEPAEIPHKPGIWELIKDFVGMDLAKIADLSLPVAVCEPVTDMQRRGDFLEYVELLHEAAHTPPGSLERLLKVTGFIVSIYSCVYRPFAPCRSPAGETFELVAPDKGIRALGEKCGECPGINAFHCEGRGWVLSADETNKIEFRGQYANIRPSGLIQIDFHDGESFSFNPLVTTVQHIILGTHYIDHYGTLHVRSSLSGLSSKIKFKEPVIGPPQHKVKGYVEKDGVRQSHPLLHGTWDGALKASWQDGAEQLLWQKNPPHKHPSRFGFSRWAVSLNSMPPGLEALLPPSDMRWRRDVGLLEEGKYEQAERKRRRMLARLREAREARTGPHRPRWFDFHPEAELGVGRRYTYKGGYFETRDMRKRGDGEWKGCPDLFGESPSNKVFS
ncbi:hypothetical protein CVIRNUC_006605 [Coccomyxa viridis]|uniref:Oxysterol-binding protein n=1 Tax=Coccomyxa viridis TaxID=1274662 RepID=A0AAV1I7S5_9CHLO|nr:hypothetical protein CVIRNUC_006605 [Coccomyxa viridis]